MLSFLLWILQNYSLEEPWFWLHCFPCHRASFPSRSVIHSHLPARSSAGAALWCPFLVSFSVELLLSSGVCYGCREQAQPLGFPVLGACLVLRQLCSPSSCWSCWLSPVCSQRCNVHLGSWCPLHLEIKAELCVCVSCQEHAPGYCVGSVIHRVISLFIFRVPSTS